MERIVSIIRNNFPQKLVAFLLAVIVWTMVNRAIGPATPTLPEQRIEMRGVPVFVLGRADIQSEVVLRPAEVDVTVKGAPQKLQHLKPQDLKLYVDISGLRGKARDTRRVQWSLSVPGVQIDSTFPRVIEVELR